jgi:hypothetical protein
MRVASVENTTENVIALADVIATITFKVCNLPVGLLCYVEWENENGHGEAPAAKVARNGTIAFAPIEAKVSIGARYDDVVFSTIFIISIII